MHQIDAHAVRIATERFGLPACLHIPVAARNEEAVRLFVGAVIQTFRPRSRHPALLVEAEFPEPIVAGLPIWQLAEATVLRARRQLWVHVESDLYRRDFQLAFPDDPLGDRVLDHVTNRRVAGLKGFRYLRVVPISRQANSSSGGLSEKWAVEYHSTPEMRTKNLQSPVQIQFADLADIVKMLDRRTGGKLQDPVNEAQALVREPGPTIPTKP